jgi:hypothetical protein
MTILKVYFENTVFRRLNLFTSSDHAIETELYLICSVSGASLKPWYGDREQCSSYHPMERSLFNFQPKHVAKTEIKCVSVEYSATGA